MSNTLKDSAENPPVLYDSLSKEERLRGARIRQALGLSLYLDQVDLLKEVGEFEGDAEGNDT